MRIGIDISQLAYPGTGVAKYLQNLVEYLIINDSNNEYVLFFSSLRGDLPESKTWSNNLRINLESFPRSSKNVLIKQFRVPPTILEILWNRLHIFPIEKFIGPIDVFISSDWTQPPTRAKKITIIYDLIVYKYPDETAEKIVNVQKRKLKWVKNEVDKIICISESSKKDAMEILGLPSARISVVYPGI